MKYRIYGAEYQVALTNWLKDAINNRVCVSIGYKDEVRLIQPHTLGMNGQLSAFQLYPEPGWRLFYLSKISEPKFDPAPNYVKNDSRLVKDGILAQV